MTPPLPPTASPLRALARRTPAAPAPAPERCEVCAQPVPADHRHLLEPVTDAVLCACRACALLFTTDTPGTGHTTDAGHIRDTEHTTTGGRPARGPRYQLIPRRRTRLEGALVDDLAWAALGVPVTLAFFVRGAPGAPDEVRACYPSPLGTTRSTVPPDAWHRLTARHPVLAGLAPRTEALLVDRAEASREQWIVPLDDCYRLVALLRTRWKGISGGDEAARAVRGFLAHLAPTETHPPVPTTHHAPPAHTAHTAWSPHSSDDDRSRPEERKRHD